MSFSTTGLELRTATKQSSVGFEPTAVLTFGLRVRRLNHSATRSHVTEGNTSCELINSLEEADTLMVDLDRNENEAITVYRLGTDACLPSKQG